MHLPGLLDMATATTLPSLTGTARAPDDAALLAYEEMAEVYDAFTQAYDYERFLTAIEALALEHGLAGNELLDVACGTGKSFVPLLERDYRVRACDLSPAMARRAREKAAGRADVVVADMRDLPDLGRFDLVTCLDDSINYLLTDDELTRTFAGFARLLRPAGVVIFDANTLRTYRSIFSQTFASDQDGIFFCWRGETSAELPPTGRAAATLEAFVPNPAEGWKRLCMRHVQRHHPQAKLRRLCRAGGLDVAAVLGQHPGVRLEGRADETEHTKLLYVARRVDASRLTGREVS
jgi:ubiquinone/menaquinone biosynthesis C-methylase UbiE